MALQPIDTEQYQAGPHLDQTWKSRRGASQTRQQAGAHLDQEAQALRPPHARRLQRSGGLAVLVQQVGIHIGAASKQAMAAAHSEPL